VINTISRYTNDLLHLLFPLHCEGCGSDIVNNNQVLCLECIYKLPETNFFTAPGNPVEQTFYGRTPVVAGAAAFYFTKHSMMQHLVTQLKYHGKKEIGEYLGRLTGKYMVAAERFASVDVIVPLPLNPKKEQKRGYNQAAVIAAGIAAITGKPVLPKATERRLFTDTQTKKDRVDRWQNMQDVFAVADVASLENKHVLLVDDIITTGATLEACGNEILKIPGSRLSIATVCWTI